MCFCPGHGTLLLRKLSVIVDGVRSCQNIPRCRAVLLRYICIELHRGYKRFTLPVHIGRRQEEMR